MTEHFSELNDLYGAFLIYRDSHLGVQGFRDYLRSLVDPNEQGVEEDISRLIGAFANYAAFESNTAH
jgi:hypothetical protein